MNLIHKRIAPLAVGLLLVVGCDRNEKPSMETATPAMSNSAGNTPANVARENSQRAASANGAPALNNDLTQTTNVQQNSTGTTGAGSPGVGTNPPATQK